MKTKIKFGAFDIFLCLLLTALIFLNVWAYSKDNTAFTYDSDTPVGISTEDIDMASDINELSGTQLEPDIEEISGAWNATVHMLSGESHPILVYEYKFKLNITQFSEDSFNIVYTQISGERTDGQPESATNIEGLALGAYDDGMLSFGLPGANEKVFNVTFELKGGELSGYGEAAAKAAWDYNHIIYMVKQTDH